MTDYVEIILDEIHHGLEGIDKVSEKEFLNSILNANHIVVVGAGRVGLALRSFSMRLSQMGLQAFTLGDSNVPALTENDLLIIGSGSGETQTIYDMAERASRKGIKIFLITATAESRISKLSYKSIILKTPSKNNKVGSFSSIQPMTTLFEQCLGIYCDSLVLKLMSEANENSDSMWKRHSILE